jgi:ubiquinone/menaquinone biosynthesis C-methylase UbiE
VSVLFTDIVGSTELRSRIGDAAADELRRQHFAALAALVVGHAGEQVKTQGDGLMAVFDSATGAVACAGEMQQVVERDNRRHGRELAIRVGISVGETTAEDGDFFGTAVVEAARLCSAAAGGQILANDLLRLLIGSRSHQSMIPSGSMILKGLPQPVAVCEVEWHRAVEPGINFGNFSEIDRAEDPDSLVEVLDRQRARPFFRGIRQKSYELLEMQPGDRILDLGCGAGDDTVELGTLVGEPGSAVGVDSSVVMINEARDRAARAGATNVDFHVGDATALDFDDDTFDGSRADRLLQHLINPEQALREMMRVTRPGRRVVVSDTDWGSRLINHPDRELTRRINDHFCDTQRTGWMGRQLHGLFARVGLELMRTSADVSVMVDWDDYAQQISYRAAQRALGAGVITEDEAARWVAQLDETVAAGGFLSSLVVFTTCGAKPFTS